MNFELIGQAVQYTFLNSKYGKSGSKSRIWQHVKQGAAADNLARVGQTLAKLQNDRLGEAVLIQRQAIDLQSEN